MPHFPLSHGTDSLMHDGCVQWRNSNEIPPMNDVIHGEVAKERNAPIARPQWRIKSLSKVGAALTSARNAVTMSAQRASGGLPLHYVCHVSGGIRNSCQKKRNVRALLYCVRQHVASRKENDEPRGRDLDNRSHDELG